MKLYVCDKGWKGAAIVVAESREKACEVANVSQWNYNPDDWEEFELNELVHTVGDC
ncbi:hypothetical protein ISREJYDI_CDS0032 [Pseudomonas phage UNO-G1W1]|uniref:Uncharacterized protein n=1 Tax=Pseudomonas phage UNO-G1W1 TaxID=3136609 RepID=A0AAX4MUZ1_9CAUD